MEKVIVAAISENGVIGRDGDIPWHYPEDLKHFRELTTGYPVVMGRKTFQSLPEDYRPLPDRLNIVLTRSGFTQEGVETAESFEEAYDIARQHSETVFIIGGENIYRQSLNEADRLEITQIHEEYKGDSQFPEFDEDNWEKVEREDRGELSFVTYRSSS